VTQGKELEKTWGGSHLPESNGAYDEVLSTHTNHKEANKLLTKTYHKKLKKKPKTKTNPLPPPSKKSSHERGMCIDRGPSQEA